MKKFRFLLFFMLLIVIACTNSDDCKDKKKEIEVECGCPADKSRKITDLEGVIYYVGEEEGQWEPYSNTYRIYIKHDNHMSSTYIICKDDLLPRSVKVLKGTENSLSVKFSGYVTSLCKSITTIPEEFYNYITLTKIEVEQKN